MLNLIEASELAEVTEYLAREVRKIAMAGADFGVLAAGTPHIVFDDVQRQSPIPLLSIVEATCDAASSLGLKRIGLFGTRFTMRGRFYPEVFSKRGITLVVPQPREQDYIHDKYFSELVKGIVLPETRDRLIGIIEGLRTRDVIEGLILGGTELSLILRDGAAAGVPLLDATQIHVRAIVTELVRP